MTMLEELKEKVAEGDAEMKKESMPWREAKALATINGWTNAELIEQLEALISDRFQRQSFRMR